MKYYSIHEFSRLIGRTPQTLRNWDKSGKLTPSHTGSNGYRYYSHQQLKEVLNIENDSGENRIVIDYCRVSSNKQKVDNLNNYLVSLNTRKEMICVKMTRGIKVMLVPNNKQNTLMFQNAGAKRWAYNWALNKEKEGYVNGGNFISDNDLRKELTQLKQTEKFSWLNNISNNVTKQAIKDACIAYQRFFKGQAKFPKLKTKKKSSPSFYQDNIKIQFTSTHVKFEKFAKNKKANKQKLNWVRLAEHNRIPFGKDVKYINPRVSHDGLNWFISVGIEYPDNLNIPMNNGIGIDVGVKDLAICSDKKVYRNINKSKKVKRLEKQHKRLQRQISRKYEINKDGLKYIKTKNIIKLEHKNRKVQHKLNGIRNNYTHQTTCEIVKRKPSYITIEDLNVSGMMKNKHLSKAVQQQSLYEFSRQIKYKGLWNNIEIRIADRWYSSSKICHECGHINKILALNDREWVCKSCGSVLDRDYNASLNLRDTDNYKIFKVA